VGKEGRNVGRKNKLSEEVKEVEERKECVKKARK